MNNDTRQQGRVSSYENRMAIGEAHEKVVLEQLRIIGWDAEMFGQGQLTDTLRKHLRKHVPITPVRWMPDIIAARSQQDGTSQVIYVDAKAGDTWKRTDNHDIELSALNAALAWQQLSLCTVWYVFTDANTITATEVATVAKRGRYNGLGSGTPFVLVPRERCIPFVNTFTDRHHP